MELHILNSRFYVIFYNFIPHEVENRIDFYIGLAIYYICNNCKKYTQSVPLAIGLSGQMLNGVPIIVQQSLAEKNRHAQMMEVTRQNLSKLGTGPAKVIFLTTWIKLKYFI